MGADRVLIAAGAISEETYVAALAASLDIAFEPLNDRSRDECPLSDDRLIEAATTGLLPLVVGNDVNIVVAPRLVDSRRLVAVAKSGADIARRIRITSAARLQDFVARHGAPRNRAPGGRMSCARASGVFRRQPVTHRLRTVAILAAFAALAAIAAPGDDIDGGRTGARRHLSRLDRACGCSAS